MLDAKVINTEYDLDQLVFTLLINGVTKEFTFWDIDNDFDNATLADVKTQLADQQWWLQLSAEARDKVAQVIHQEVTTS